MDAFLVGLTDHVQGLHWNLLSEAGHKIAVGEWNDVRGVVQQLQQIKAEYRGEALRVLGHSAPFELEADYRHDALMVRAVLHDFEDSAARVDAAWWRAQRGESQVLFEKIGPLENTAMWISKAASVVTWGSPLWSISKLWALKESAESLGLSENQKAELKLALADAFKKLATGVSVGAAAALAIGAFMLTRK